MLCVNLSAVNLNRAADSAIFNVLYKLTKADKV